MSNDSSFGDLLRSQCYETLFLQLCLQAPTLISVSLRHWGVIGAGLSLLFPLIPFGIPQFLRPTAALCFSSEAGYQVPTHFNRNLQEWGNRRHATENLSRAFKACGCCSEPFLVQLSSFVDIRRKWFGKNSSFCRL